MYINTIDGVNVAINDCFSEMYPVIVRSLRDHAKEVDSRNGKTREFLDFKTTLTNPRKRCVGGFNRNINPFFLLYEAIWIWNGDYKVDNLSFFNKQMRNYSDDGSTFHAAYGFRLRQHGMHAADFKNITEENKHAFYGMDQITEAVCQAYKDPESRRIVLTIWNAYLDLSGESKDIPCNDLLMFKIRDGKLNLTISNRSNDVHWGLPTNLFQFSFLLEIMSNIMGLEVGQQTHNSNSLHVYESNPLTETMMNRYYNQLANFGFTATGIELSKPTKSFKAHGWLGDLYEYCEPTPMDFTFSEAANANGRLIQFDSYMKNLQRALDETYIKEFYNDEKANFLSYSYDLRERANTRTNKFLKFASAPFYDNNSKSQWFLVVYNILLVYIVYKKQMKQPKAKQNAVCDLYLLYKTHNICSDLFLLSMNWFCSFLSIEDRTELFDILTCGTRENIFYNLDNNLIGEL